MYTSRLHLYRQDNLGYRFCSPKWAQSRQAASPEDLSAQIEAIDPKRCHRLVFTGGSPLQHPGFFEAVEACRAKGLGNFVLETDGKGLAEAGTLERLKEAGFTAVYTYLAATKEPLHDVVFHDAGSFAEVTNGYKAALESGLDVYCIVPAVRWNVLEIEPLLDWATSQGPKPKGFLLSFPPIEHVPAAMRRGVLPFSALAKLAGSVFLKAKYKRIEHGFMVKRGIPPCSSHGHLDQFGTVFHERINYFKHKDDPVKRVAACESCVLNNACKGVEAAYVEQFGDREFRSVDLDTATEWKLRPMNTLEAVDYQQISEFDNPDTNNDMALVRVNGHCNMACSFCFVDRTVDDYDTEKLLAHIRRLVDGGIKHLIVSGGEPTLHPDLPEIIAGARDMGLTSIEMQSNGVRAANFEYAKLLHECGLTMVTVSLHSTDAEMSDDITKLPKAFGKTVEAMHNFRKLGIRTQIAHVITKMNYKGLPRFVRFLRSEFPEKEGHVSICFAIAQGISDLVFQAVIPTYTEIKPYLTDALDFCLENEVGFGGLIGQGGYPPCMLNGDLRYYENVMHKIYKSADHDEQFYKADRCRECAFNDHCVGVRRAYIDAYGDDEIKPFKLGDKLTVEV